jgi:thiol:disulfide interchange protein
MLAIIDAPIILGLLLVGVPLLILPIWFAWVALDRAGLSGALSLLILVPFGIVIVLGILAFAKWPNLPQQG